MILPTFQRRDSVARALHALGRQTLPPAEYEVIVSIDGSEDGTRELVSRWTAAHGVRALWRPNGGRAAACNAGVAAAIGEVLVFLDDDMEPESRCLEAHLRAHPAGTRFGVVGAAPIAVNASSPPVVRYIGGKFNRHLATLGAPGFEFKLRDFYSGNFSVRREVLLEAGGFDESFTIYGNEDLELSVRLRRADVRLVYSAAAVARQHYDKSFEALACDNVAKGRTAVKLASKHPSTFGELKLSTYGQGSLKRRAALAALLAFTRAWPDTARLAAWFMSRLGALPGRWLNDVYAFALDYFYWVGARAAQRGAAANGRPRS